MENQSSVFNMKYELLLKNQISEFLTTNLSFSWKIKTPILTVMCKLLNGNQNTDFNVKPELFEI